AERIISYRNRNENSGILLTNREFHLQTGNLAYKTGFSFTKRESWVTKGILGLLFTLLINNLKNKVRHNEAFIHNIIDIIDIVHYIW
ncbi:hypothetical protein, partial [Agathobacter rectalis]|uniref:hypothetical protein n=1 Tax=Agathobacter rectalis TaxID=39491 RepID=UPI0027D23887